MKINKYKLKILLQTILILFFQSCQSQTKDNPQYIGEKSKAFDLDKATFKENVDTLFSKIAHVKIEKKGDGGKLFHIYRVKVSEQKDNLFNYFNLNEGDVDVFTNQNNDIVLFSGMKQIKKEDAEKLMKQLRGKYKKQEIDFKKNQFVDDTFIGIINDKLIHITMTCYKEGDFKEECNVVYKLYKYPQKDNDVLRIMTPAVDVENLLKK